MRSKILFTLFILLILVLTVPSIMNWLNPPKQEFKSDYHLEKSELYVPIKEYDMESNQNDLEDRELDLIWDRLEKDGTLDRIGKTIQKTTPRIGQVRYPPQKEFEKDTLKMDSILTPKLDSSRN